MPVSLENSKAVSNALRISFIEKRGIRLLQIFEIQVFRKQQLISI